MIRWVDKKKDVKYRDRYTLINFNRYTLISFNVYRNKSYKIKFIDLYCIV